jgi:hypothetical protein
VEPVPDPLLLRKSGSAGKNSGPLGLHSGPLTTEQKMRATGVISMKKLTDLFQLYSHHGVYKIAVG